MTWQNLTNMMTVLTAVIGIATALCLSILWVLKQRREAEQRLSIRVIRPLNHLFQVEVCYTPKSLNQAIFAELSSLGDNPIYLLPKLHQGLPEKLDDELIAAMTWPKARGQHTSRRLVSIDGSATLSATFRVVPRFTDASGWLHVRILTKGPYERTLIRRRMPVSII